MTQRVRIVVTGRVQGVGYRAAAQNVAVELGVMGWVANRDDGTVELLAQGAAPKIAEFIAWCQQGPRLARVDAIEIDERPVGSEFSGFTIRHGMR